MTRKKHKLIKDKELNKISGGRRSEGARDRARGRGRGATAPAAPPSSEAGETGGAQPPIEGSYGGGSGSGSGSGGIQRSTLGTKTTIFLDPKTGRTFERSK